MDQKSAKNAYVTALFTLLSGTAAAQAIPILASPAIARLYTPEDLGTLALFSSVTAILCVFATGRFELAIPVVRSETEAFHILCGAAGLALVVSASLYPVVLFGGYEISGLLGNQYLSEWLWLLPLSVAFSSVFQLLTYWTNRKREYIEMARSRVAQAGGTALAQLTLGLVCVGAGGLVGSLVFGQLIGLFLLGLLAWQRDRHRLTTRAFHRCKLALRRQRRFPLFMIPGQLSNVLSLQIAVILLSLCYGHAVAGYYALAERVIIAPSAIVGTAVGDVFRQHAADLYRKNGNCRSLYLRTSLFLGGVATLAFLVLVFASKWLFVVIFGENWAASGEIATIMSALMFFQVISSPLSQTVYLAKLEHIDMIWQFSRLILSGLAILAGYFIWNDYHMSVALYVATVSLLYMAHLILQYKVASGGVLAVGAGR